MKTNKKILISKNIMAKMFELSAQHLDSLEVYCQFPDTPPEIIDGCKHLIQKMLQLVAEKEFISNQP